MKAKVVLKITIRELDNSTRVWTNVQEGQFENDQALQAYVLTKIAKVAAEQGILEIDSEGYHVKFIPWQRILDLDCHAEVASSLAIDGDIEAAKRIAESTKAADDLIRGKGTLEFPTGSKTGKGYRN